jgi:glucosylglycerate synthase
MASTPFQPAATAAQSPASQSSVQPIAPDLSHCLLVSVAPLPPDALETTLGNLSQAFAGTPVLVSTPGLPADALDPTQNHDLPSRSDLVRRFTNLHLLADPPALPAPGAWVLTAADFLNTFKLAEQYSASACLLLGSEAQSLTPDALRSLADAVLRDGSIAGADLAVPRYDLGPRDGLVNSAILYPTSRAIFGTRPRFPLAIDLGLSLRMAERLATAAQRFTAMGQNEALLWPVAESAIAGFSLIEVPTGTRAIPHPDNADLNSVLARVTASLFADIEARAAFWQRSRVAQPSGRPSPLPPLPADPFAGLDIQPMLDSFRLAYTSLYEIWSLVLPPNSLLGLKRLALADPKTFRLPDALWARIVYDFLLAFRLRTLNRGHLLGALTPLYLGWVASHILYCRSGVHPERHIEELAQAFEFDKPYLVSRWRWPDRFNP